MRFTDVVEKINSCVEKYETLQLKFITDQTEILRTLSTNLYYLEEYRINYHKEWLKVYTNSKEKTNAGREREADIKVPEIYMVRRIMNGGYRVLDSVRSTISVHKKENI